MTRALRKHLAARGVGDRGKFRWRGGTEISRLEGFADAVFAFAVTLLVVSLEVPRTYSELIHVLQGFLAFAICFVLLFAIWYQHYVFFRRYGLEDLTVIILNGALIFVVLFYVYPLKFLFSVLVDQLLGRPNSAVATFEELAHLFLLFYAGYVAVFTIFALLFGHAYRKRRELELNEIEILDTRESIWSAVLQIIIGLVSLSIAGLADPRLSPWAGFIYMANAPTQAALGTIFGRRRRKLAAFDHCALKPQLGEARGPGVEAPGAG
jgi:uncharacterized membrane protein